MSTPAPAAAPTPTPAPAAAPAPTATPTTPVTVAAPAPTPAPAANAIDWLPGADDLTVGLVQNKAWKGPADAVKAYQNVQSLIGANPDSIVRLPGDGADKATLDAFYTKLGRPADPKGYDIPVPEGVSPVYADWAKSTFHELGISAAQAKALATKNNEFAAAQTKAAADARAADFESQNAKLKAEWGAAYDKNVTVVDNAVHAFGMKPEHLAAIRDAIGPLEAMKFMHNLGNRLGEDQFLSAEQKSNGFTTLMTPQAAQQKIVELRADKEWTKGYLAGATDKKAQMAQLQAWAHPEG